MKQSHTHRGHCQACGAIQAMDAGNNLLAKHGYKVAGFGYFAGVCFGAAHLPMEQERTLTDKIIADMVRITAENRAEAAALKAGTIKPEKARTDVRDNSNPKLAMWERPYVQVAFADATPAQQERAVEWAISECERSADFHERHGQMMGDLLKRVHGKDPLPAETKVAAPVEIYPGLKFKAANGTVWEVKAKQWGTRWSAKYLEGSIAGNVGKVFNVTATEIRTAIRAGGKL